VGRQRPGTNGSAAWADGESGVEACVPVSASSKALGLGGRVGRGFRCPACGSGVVRVQGASDGPGWVVVPGVRRAFAQVGFGRCSGRDDSREELGWLWPGLAGRGSASGTSGDVPTHSVPFPAGGRSLSDPYETMAEWPFTASRSRVEILRSDFVNGWKIVGAGGHNRSHVRVGVVRR
jgi:hypothetical protein